MTLLDSKDVLILDDDEAIRGMLVASLTRLGITCHTAADGAEGLARIEATQYSVVLVDLMMPRVDGAAFVTALREHERASVERPVVLLMTAFPVRERVPEMGAKIQAVIQKPFDVLEIAELVRDCVDARRQQDPPRPVTDGTDRGKVADRRSQIADSPAARDPRPGT